MLGTRNITGNQTDTIHASGSLQSSHSQGSLLLVLDKTMLDWAVTRLSQGERSVFWCCQMKRYRWWAEWMHSSPGRGSCKRVAGKGGRRVSVRGMQCQTGHCGLWRWRKGATSHQVFNGTGSEACNNLMVWDL